MKKTTLTVERYSQLVEKAARDVAMDRISPESAAERVVLVLSEYKGNLDKVMVLSHIMYTKEMHGDYFRMGIM